MATKNQYIARRLAAQMWGPVKSQRKIAHGVWQFENTWNGGIVVDTDIRPELKEFEKTVGIKKNSLYYRPSEQHFAPLEDAKAAIAEWLYSEEILTRKYMRRFSPQIQMSFENWKKNRIKSLEQCLQKRYPVWFSKQETKEAKYYVEIKYSFDEDVVTSKDYETVEEAAKVLHILLMEEVRYCIIESKESVSVLVMPDDPEKLVILVYKGNDDKAEYRVKRQKCGHKEA